MSAGLLLALGGASALVLALAAYLLLRVSDTDVAVAARLEAARGTWTEPNLLNSPRKTPGPGLLRPMQHAITGLGRAVMQSGILPGRTRAELEQTLSSAGFRGANALAMFVGSKLAMLAGLPFAAWLLTRHWESSTNTALLIIAIAAVAGLVAPDFIIKRIRKRYLTRLEGGLSDALDLMVICAQSGLSLEPAMIRVSTELRTVHPEMCLELATTVRELEMMSDSSAALANLGRRTGLDSLIRLTSTLSQTMQYGTPLSDSLRTLSNEMRTAALTRFEERAARLPVLLTLPMILFILPSLFMIVGGPAVIQIMHSMAK